MYRPQSTAGKKVMVSSQSVMSSMMGFTLDLASRRPISIPVVPASRMTRTLLVGSGEVTETCSVCPAIIFLALVAALERLYVW